MATQPSCLGQPLLWVFPPSLSPRNRFASRRCLETQDFVPVSKRKIAKGLFRSLPLHQAVRPAPRAEARNVALWSLSRSTKRKASFGLSRKQASRSSPAERRPGGRKRSSGAGRAHGLPGAETLPGGRTCPPQDADEESGGGKRPEGFGPRESEASLS